MDATEIYFYLRTAHTIDFRQSACRSWHWTGIQSATGIGPTLGQPTLPSAAVPARRSVEKVRRACPVDLKLYNGSSAFAVPPRHKTASCLAGVGGCSPAGG